MSPVLVVGRVGRAGGDSVLRSPYSIYVAAKASIKPAGVEPEAGRIIASCVGAVKRN